VVGASGEYSDFQYVDKLLNMLTCVPFLVLLRFLAAQWTRGSSWLRRTEEFCYDDGAVLTPREIHSYLGRVFYNRRSKINPLWNSVITAGFHNGKRCAQL
jgi:20S proteasome subunit beta 7